MSAPDAKGDETCVIASFIAAEKQMVQMKMRVPLDH